MMKYMDNLIMLSRLGVFYGLIAILVTISHAQSTSSCIEDFTSDNDPTMPGLASSTFSHSISGIYRLGGPGFPGAPASHSLGLFAGATDVITFPGQAPTYARVQIVDYGHGTVTFEGVGDTLTSFFSPTPAVQFREATHMTLGDNGLPIGQIVKVTLRGFETFFDNVEISPCMTAPTTVNVDVIVKPGAINPRRNDGLMKAVILSSAGFNAATVDPATVQFGDATVPFRYFFGDEDEDGDTDLIFFFLVGEVGVKCGDTAIPLTGQTTSGQEISGVGAIETVGCP